MFRLTSLLLGSLLILPSSAQEEEAPTEANIFVALDGNDANPGIKNTPKAMIRGALRTISE